MEELPPKASSVNFGSSLLVPSVQELSKQHINTEIPIRYIRSDQESPITSTLHASCLPSVPVIDVHCLISHEPDAAESELDRLHSACKNWGFFQVVNHGVSSLLIEKIKLEIKDFFELPLEEKQKLWQQPGDHDGFGQQFVVSEDQKLDWSDMFHITTLPSIAKNFHLFAKLPMPLRETLEIYSLEIQKLAITIIGQMAKALKMDVQEMRHLFDDGIQTMRLNYYPVCSQPEKAIGFTAHSDADALTILLQLSETEGLQIRNEGKWIPVKPLPNAFIVNLGDIMEIFSNGIYRSIEHRAVVNSTKERLSIATFYSTNLDAEIGPVSSLIEPHKPALFKRVMTEKYFKEFFAREIKVNHGVSSSLIEKIKLEIKDFFELPLETKQKLWQQPGDQEGFGQLFVVSEDQKLDWSDMFFITTLPTSIRKPHLFEKLPVPLRETLESYSLEIQKLAMTILRQMAKALQMDAEDMRQLFNDGLQSMRLNYYPLCSQPEKAIGFTPHSDASALTILLQLNETEGLQIRNEGKWIPVKPLPNAFVVNIGDIMEIVSNGVYRSIEHIAIVNSTKERLSIATFCRTNLKAEIGPAPSLIEPHNPALFKLVMTEKYFKDFFAREIKGKSYLDSMRINGTGEEQTS